MHGKKTTTTTTKEAHLLQCVYASTWLTMSFQSLMMFRVQPLLPVYSVRLKVAAAPHKSNSLSPSLIVTSAWARLLRSYAHMKQTVHLAMYKPGGDLSLKTVDATSSYAYDFLMQSEHFSPRISNSFKTENINEKLIKTMATETKVEVFNP